VIYQYYINRVSVIQHYNILCSFNKLLDPPTPVTWIQLLRKQTNTGTSPPWLHKLTGLRAQNFAHCHELSHDPGSLSLRAPEAEHFMELLLLHQTADMRKVYHLGFIKHTAAVLKAVMCDSVTSFFFLIFEGHASQSNIQLQPVFTKECYFSLHICITSYLYPLAYSFIYLFTLGREFLFANLLNNYNFQFLN
jgi:hypothetical protein